MYNAETTSCHAQVVYVEKNIFIFKSEELCKCRGKEVRGRKVFILLATPSFPADTAVL